MIFNIPSVFLSSTVENMPNIDISNVTGGVVDISEAISNYGIAIVLLAVFFVIFLILIIIMLYTNNKMMTSIMKNSQTSTEHDQELLSKIFDNAIKGNSTNENGDSTVDILSQRLNEAVNGLQKTIEEKLRMENATKQIEPVDDYHKDLVGNYIDLNMTFKNISRDTLIRLNCERVAIYIFHNGNKSMFGLPFFKMSCIHEWTAHGSKTLRGRSHVDLPLHIFNDFIESLHSYGVYKAEDIAVAKEEDPCIGEFVAYSNTKAVYMDAVKSDDGVIAGFVVSEFSRPDTFETDDKRDMEVRAIMDDMVSKITPIIITQYAYNANK